MGESEHAGGDGSPIPDTKPRTIEGAFAIWKARIAQSKQAEKAAQASYPLNVTLIVIVSALAIRYYWLHLEPVFTQVLFVGIPLTAWTAFEIVRSLLPSKLLPGDRRSVVESILSRRDATPWLWFVLAVLFLANAFTASLYLKHTSGAEVVEIQLKSGSLPFRDNLRADTKQPNDGCYYFFRWSWLRHPVALAVSVEKPFGYHVKQPQQMIYPWSAVTWNFPDDFEKTPYWICRVLPQGSTLWAIKPFEPDRHASDFKLEFIMDGVTHPASENVSFNCFYFGADRRAMQHEIDAESVDSRRLRIQRSVPSIPVDKARQLAEGQPLIFQVDELKSKSKVKVIIRDAMGILGESAEVDVPETPGIFDVVVRANE